MQILIQYRQKNQSWNDSYAPCKNSIETLKEV
jgi:hypothetical protein